MISVRPAKRFSGVVSVPGDKSISHRAAILSSIADGPIEINGFLTSEDCLNTLKAMRSLGVKTHGVGLWGLKKPKKVLDLGNSGTGLRLLAGLVSGYPFTTKLTGDKSLRRRPMLRIVKPLTQMGARIEGERCPLTIIGGNLKGIDYISPIASAQVKSCILIAGLLAKGSTSVTEPIKTRDHTERLLKYLGADIKVDGLKVTVKGGVRLKARPIKIPGDISSAAFILAGGLIVPGGNVTVKGVGINPTRSAVLGILKRMGADIKVKKLPSQYEPIADINVRYSKLRGITIGPHEVPGLIDELPIISVLASVAKGRTVISGAGELRVKESDRIRSIAVNLAKFGVDIIEKEDGWIINGGRPLKGAVVSSFGDHRIAMAMVIAGLVAKGQTVVKDTKWIDTSFPGFMDLINRLSRRLIIAIDGTAGSGKSTLAKALAKRLGYKYIDTGAMYRYLTYRALKEKRKDFVNLASQIKVFPKTDKIRLPEVSDMVSKVSAIKGVRKWMVKHQRKIGRGVVIEGRDIGTVVFPDADIKFFLTASVEERTRRRYKELKQKGIRISIKNVRENIISRDVKDSSRKVSPLKPAPDAIIIDTTNLSMKQKNELAWRYVI